MLLTTFARADDEPGSRGVTWRDTYVTRLQALALIQTLNANLLSHDSATLTLDEWCEKHHLASPAKVIAERVQGAERQPTADQRKLLGVSTSEPVRYRRVRLRCGDHVLSEAENWYVPSRLTPEMNRTLDTTDTSFGRVVRPLQFRRRTLSATVLWSPLPEGWEMGVSIPEQRSARLRIPREVLQHRAVLTLPDGTPFSALVETYTSEVLAFPEPAAPSREPHR
ncbi:MAG: hypothetical protein IRZ28_22450 [Steroidobacteraceae bacterium]|nr:hypothetical protein [Steroidobacteraceae bacterium]